MPYLVCHAHAGDKRAWADPDRRRPRAGRAPGGVLAIDPQRGHPRLPWWSFAVIPQDPTAANQTALNGMPSQPELPRPYWSGLSGRWAVIS